MQFFDFDAASLQSLRNGAYSFTCTALEFPSVIEFSEATESIAGSGIAGSYYVLGTIIAQAGAETTWTGFAPNDGKLRYGRARTIQDNSGSSYLDLGSVRPWDPPSTGSLAITALTASLSVLSVTSSLTTTSSIAISSSYAATASAAAPKFTVSGTLLMRGPMAFDIPSLGNALDMSNCNIFNVNNVAIADPGASEGITWGGGNLWAIYESPNDLSNTLGNLQFVESATRRFTIYTGSLVESVFNHRIGGTASFDSGAATVGATSSLNVLAINTTLNPKEQFAIGLSTLNSVRIGPVGNDGSTVLIIAPATGSQVGPIIRGTTLQARNLLEIQNPSNATMMSVSPSGAITSQTTITAVGGFSGSIASASFASSSYTTLTASYAATASTGGTPSFNPSTPFASDLGTSAGPWKVLYVGQGPGSEQSTLSHGLVIQRSGSYAPLRLYSAGDGTHNGAQIDIVATGSGGTEGLHCIINNWSGFSGSAFLLKVGSGVGLWPLVSFDALTAGGASTLGTGRLRIYSASVATVTLSTEGVSSFANNVSASAFTASLGVQSLGDVKIGSLGVVQSTVAPSQDQFLSYSSSVNAPGKWIPRTVQLQTNSGIMNAGTLIDGTTVVVANAQGNIAMVGAPTAPVAAPSVFPMYQSNLVDLGAVPTSGTVWVVQYQYTASVDPNASSSFVFGVPTGGADPNVLVTTGQKVVHSRLNTNYKYSYRFWNSGSNSSSGSIAGPSPSSSLTQPSTGSEVNAFGLIVASQIAVDTLAAITGNLGDLGVGRIHNPGNTAGMLLGGYSLPLTWTKYIDFTATGSQPVFHVDNALDISAMGSASFQGDVNANTLQVASSSRFNGNIYGSSSFLGALRLAATSNDDTDTISKQLVINNDNISIYDASASLTSYMGDYNLTGSVGTVLSAFDNVWVVSASGDGIRGYNTSSLSFPFLSNPITGSESGSASSSLDRTFKVNFTRSLDTRNMCVLPAICGSFTSLEVDLFMTTYYRTRVDAAWKAAVGAVTTYNYTQHPTLVTSGTLVTQQGNHSVTLTASLSSTDQLEFKIEPSLQVIKNLNNSLLTANPGNGRATGSVTGSSITWNAVSANPVQVARRNWRFYPSGGNSPQFKLEPASVIPTGSAGTNQEGEVVYLSNATTHSLLVHNGFNYVDALSPAVSGVLYSPVGVPSQPRRIATVLFSTHSVFTTSTTEASIASTNLPAKSFASGGDGIRIVVVGIAQACTAPKIRVQFGGTNIDTNTTMGASDNYRLECYVYSNSSNAQRANAILDYGTTNPGGHQYLGQTILSKTDTSDILIDIRGLTGGGTSFQVHYAVIEYLPRP